MNFPIMVNANNISHTPHMSKAHVVFIYYKKWREKKETKLTRIKDYTDIEDSPCYIFMKHKQIHKAPCKHDKFCQTTVLNLGALILPNFCKNVWQLEMKITFEK